MTDNQEGRFTAVDIKAFRSATRDICFDVYLRLSEDNYVHVFSSSMGIDYKRLAQYIQKGVTHLYIPKEDEEKFRAFMTITADSIFNSSETPVERKIAALLNMTEQNMAEIFSTMSISEQTAASTEKVIRNYVTLMTESPQTLAILLKLVSHGDFLYYHSIAVSIFSIVLGQSLGNLDKRAIELLGMGGFLHDAGAAQAVSASGGKTNPWDEESEDMKAHARIGLQLLENNPLIPDEVRYIVYQHHEQPGGHGYPNQLRGSVIYFPAKIVAAVDGFSRLISKVPDRPSLTPEKAIAAMEAERGKYEPALVQALGQAFLKGSKKAA